jgi:hypothetical protein
MFTHKSSVLDDWCAKSGRDPSEVERSAGLEPKMMEHADQYAAAGAHEITIGLNGPDFDMGPVRELLDWRNKT